MDPKLRESLVKHREEYRQKRNRSDLICVIFLELGIIGFLWGLRTDHSDSWFWWVFLVGPLLPWIVGVAYAGQSMKYSYIVSNLSDKRLAHAHKSRRDLILHILLGTPFALYLRDFQYESHSHHVSAGMASAENFSDLMQEGLVKDLAPWKVFSIANRVMLGADTHVQWVYLDDQDWEQKVQLYVSYADLIVVNLYRRSPGISRELEMVLETNSSRRTLLIVSTDQTDREVNERYGPFRWVLRPSSRNYLGHLPTQIQQCIRQLRSLPRKVDLVGTELFDSADEFELCEQLLRTNRIPDGAASGTIDLTRGTIRWDNPA